MPAYGHGEGAETLHREHRETVISRTEYAYDAQGRIEFMKLFAPVAPADELAKTEFFYAGASEVAARTEVTSAPEKKVSLVR